MKLTFLPVVLGLSLSCGCVNAAPETTAPAPAPAPATKPMSLYDYKLKTLDGKDATLSEYKGKVLLIVNTASKCGFTPQYAALQKIWQDDEKAGLVVLGFPSNDFGGQEPGTATEIAEFCQKNYGVNFPLFEKGPVKGGEKQALFAYLTDEANPDMKGEIGWNFEKFLISRDGKLVGRFKSNVKPDSEEFVKAVNAELAKPAPEAPKPAA